jgi:hypothetical protein
MATDDKPHQEPQKVPVRESDTRDINAGRETTMERPIQWPPPPPPEKQGS